MKVKALRKVLGVAEKHYREDGKLAEAEALSAFAANLLSGNGDVAVASLVRRIEDARKGRPPAPGRPRPRRNRHQARGG